MSSVWLLQQFLQKSHWSHLYPVKIHTLSIESDAHVIPNPPACKDPDSVPVSSTCNLSMHKFSRKHSWCPAYLCLSHILRQVPRISSWKGNYLLHHDASPWPQEESVSKEAFPVMLPPPKPNPCRWHHTFLVHCPVATLGILDDPGINFDTNQLGEMLYYSFVNWDPTQLRKNCFWLSVSYGWCPNLCNNKEEWVLTG